MFGSNLFFLSPHIAHYTYPGIIVTEKLLHYTFLSSAFFSINLIRVK
jgi:hypothetical protein